MFAGKLSSFHSLEESFCLIKCCCSSMNMFHFVLKCSLKFLVNTSNWYLSNNSSNQTFIHNRNTSWLNSQRNSSQNKFIKETQKFPQKQISWYLIQKLLHPLLLLSWFSNFKIKFPSKTWTHHFVYFSNRIYSNFNI